MRLISLEWDHDTTTNMKIKSHSFLQSVPEWCNKNGITKSIYIRKSLKVSEVKLILRKPILFSLEQQFYLLYMTKIL